jgi:acyl-CoA hydrolase
MISGGLYLLVDIIGRKLVTVEEAFSLLPSTGQLVTSMAAAEPQGFFTHLGDYAGQKTELNIHCANPSRVYSCFSDLTLCNHIRLYVMFLTAAVRKHQGHGVVHYVPQHLSQWAGNLIKQGVDIFWGSCTSPDERGFVSLGTGACYEPEVLRVAKKVILEINPQMPQTHGATQVPLSWVDHFIAADNPLPTIPKSSVGPEEKAIGELVAELIPDGATCQLGIGAIPDAIGDFLRDKKNLGVHTELINDCMMNLYLQGVITGREKTIWPGKIVGSFVFGSKALYDFVHNNPVVELQPASVVNDPYRIGRNNKMVSINTAVEIDITGQVCAESIGHMQISGVGGASETHCGAQRSPGGRGIVALKSSGNDYKGKRFSKIVAALHPGAKVSISRNDIDTVVSEFGVAQLKGKSVAERAKAMIALAHPIFREELLAAAKLYNYL